MIITIVGTGYVGLVTGACFAEMGNDVTCIDIDEEKLAKLMDGIIPIHEPGLDGLITRNVAAGRINFSNNLESSLHESTVVFIAVGTPPNEDGSADLSHVLGVATQIGEKLKHSTVIVDKSTVPIGTAEKVQAAIRSALDERGVNIDFDVVSNPEFLKEGAAIGDFMSPDRIVIGYSKESSCDVMRELYAPFSRNHDKIQFMGVRDAEMTKYAANAMLATKISFMNEIALMCDHYGVDVENVRKGIGSDPRVGYSFIYPGSGYGGSCFPKDVRALISMAEAVGLDPKIFSAVEERNQRQKTVLVPKIHEKMGEDLSGKTFAFWGLAFKPETDDVREAPALDTIRAVVGAGAKVRAFDPEALETAKDSLSDIDSGSLIFVSSPEEAVEGADALVVMTEWKAFRQPDFKLLSNLSARVIFDGRNIYDPVQVLNHGLDYIGVGRNSDLVKS